MSKRIGIVEVDDNRCKSCKLCVDTCPTHSLAISPRLNRLGFHPVKFLPDTGCTACGLCFYACPEPAAIRVLFQNGRAA